MQSKITQREVLVYLQTHWLFKLSMPYGGMGLKDSLEMLK